MGSENEDREGHIVDHLSPRSSLKVIDEAMEFELFHLAENGVFDRGGEMGSADELEHFLSDEERGQDCEVLA